MVESKDLDMHNPWAPDIHWRVENELDLGEMEEFAWYGQERLPEPTLKPSSMKNFSFLEESLLSYSFFPFYRN